MRDKLERRYSEGWLSLTFRIGQNVWIVHFLDISRLDDSWLIECAIDGPRAKRVTIRAAVEPHAGLTAQRVIAALREWLASGDPRDQVVLELLALEKAV